MCVAFFFCKSTGEMHLVNLYTSHNDTKKIAEIKLLHK